MKTEQIQRFKDSMNRLLERDLQRVVEEIVDYYYQDRDLVASTQVEYDLSRVYLPE